ncbi:MAG: hypothetical protein WCI51_07210 [Lentisphaerota bacterium]
MEAKKVNQKAARVLERLYQAMFDGPDMVEEVGHALFKKNSTYLPVNVEQTWRLISKKNSEDYHSSPSIISVMHFGEQNGDLMRDPDVTFLRVEESTFIPLTFQNDYAGFYGEYADVNDDGTINLTEPMKQADLALFCDDWMENINDQQELGVA